MAEQALAAGLTAVPVVTNHFHKVADPIQRRYRRMTGQDREDPEIHDHRTMEDKGYTLRRRSQVGSDEEIVETVRHRGEVRDRRPGRPSMSRRRSSMNDAYSRRDYGGGYESEGSVPPRSRTRAKSQGGKSKKGSSSSSTSSSDLGSSTDEEKEATKMQRKKWLTAALASVATIHAASKVYSSIESHDKRIIEVQQGKISPEEAHKKQRNARWQDAAAIGIAALGIKGAISEWNEVSEEHEHHKEFLKQKEENHKKRLERQRRQKAREHGGYYKGRDGEWYYDGPEPQKSERRELDGPRNGDRKLLEGPRDRSRSAYGGGGYKSDYRSEGGRSRSRYGGGGDRDRDRSRRASTRYADDDDY